MSKTKLFLVTLLPICLILLLVLPWQTAVATPEAPNGDDSVSIYLPTIFNNYCAAPFFDDFSGDYGWPTGDTGKILYRYYNNEYNIFHREKENWFGVTRGDRWESDKMVQAQGRTPSGESVWGLIFGLNDDWTDFYTFEIFPNQRTWYIFHFTSASGWSLVQNNGNSAVQPGTAINTIRIERNAANGNMQFYINGSYMTSLAEKDGRVGLSGASLADNTDIRYDDYHFILDECPNDDPYTRPEPPAAGSITLDRPAIDSLPSQLDPSS